MNDVKIWRLFVQLGSIRTHFSSRGRSAFILVLLTVQDGAVFRTEHHSDCADGATPSNHTHDCEVDDSSQILWLRQWFTLLAQLEVAVKRDYIDDID